LNWGRIDNYVTEPVRDKIISPVGIYVPIDEVAPVQIYAHQKHFQEYKMRILANREGKPVLEFTNSQDVPSSYQDNADDPPGNLNVR
jgi:galactokinase/mevalonate kinase-like predicted kinase